MHRRPGELGLHTLHRAPAEHLDDRSAAPDRRHRALVLVLERLGLLVRDAPRDVLPRPFARLQRDRAELGEHLVRLRVGDRSDVAERVDLGVIRHCELRRDADAVAPLQLEPERLHEPIPGEAGAPDERVRFELGTRLERDARGRDRGDGIARHDLDREFLQRLDRVLLEVLLEHREDLRSRLDEDDAHLVVRQVRVVLGEVGAVELR